MSNNNANYWDRDPKNWKLGMFYFCNEDPRIMLPKRIPMLGWTVNFARWQSWLLIAAIIGFAAMFGRFHWF
jgi:uncharacterized membrane protein